MAFDINSFKTELHTNGYLRTHSYRVILTPPSAMLIATNIMPMISMRAEEVRTPTASLATVDVPRYGIGPTQKQVVSNQFNDITVSLISDKYGNLWNFLHTWLNTIFSYSPAANGGANPTYTAEYKSNFSTTMTIEIFDQIGKTPITFTMNMAYPIQIREVNMDWSETGNLVYLDVAMTFRDYSLTINA